MSPLPVTLVILTLHSCLLQNPAFARHVSEEFLADMLVPMNTSHQHRNRRSEDAIEGSGAAPYREIPPIGRSLGLYMERLQEAPDEMSDRSKESLEENMEVKDGDIDNTGDEGSGASQLEIEVPKMAAIVAPPDDPFNEEEGMEDVLKDLKGGEPADDQNKHDNTLSVLLDSENLSTNIDDDVISAPVTDNDDEGSGGGALAAVAIDSQEEEVVPELLHETHNQNDVDSVEEHRTEKEIALKEEGEEEHSHGEDVDVLAKESATEESLSTEEVPPRADSVGGELEIIPAANITVDDTEPSNAVSENYETTTEISFDEMSTEYTEDHEVETTPETELPTTLSTESTPVVAVSTEVPLVVEVSSPETTTLHAVETTTEFETTEATTEASTEIPVTVVVPSTQSSTTTTTTEAPPPSSTEAESTTTEKTFTDVAIPVIGSEQESTTLLSEVTTTTVPSVESSSLSPISSSTEVIVAANIENALLSPEANKDLSEAESTHQDMTVLAAGHPDIADGDKKQLAVYVLVGFAGICLIVLLVFLLMKRKTSRRNVDLESSQDKDTERTLLSLGKYKDDSDENNVKNNEITPLVIKQNSQINKFEKNPNFSSPKNLNTTANEKNIEKDNVLKSTQAIIEEEEDDAKKTVCDENKDEKPGEAEKKALLDENKAPTTEKHVVRTLIDQDSIPRKPIIVTRNGNGYHTVSQDPV